MSTLNLTRELVAPAVIGGCILGGGGGGSMQEGMEVALIATSIGTVRLVDVDDIPHDSTITTVSAVGAPSAKDAYIEPVHYVRAVEFLQRVKDLKITGLITNECGGFSTVNGWLQAALLGLPVVDAPCNGRAHPTGIMGAMGLHKAEGYRSIQAAIGGRAENGTYLEVLAIGSVEKASSVVRNVAVQAGGLVAVARNPVSGSYVKDNAAIGAVKQAIELGKVVLASKERGSRNVIQATCDFLQGNLITIGTVQEVSLISEGGFDAGECLLDSGYDITFWNEYMTLEAKGQRIATFPDLIVTINMDDGMPLTSADLRVGQQIAVLKIDKENIKLGAGMKDPALFRACEKAIGKQIIAYSF